MNTNYEQIVNSNYEHKFAYQYCKLEKILLLV